MAKDGFFKKFDLVRLAGGGKMIVVEVHPQRPVNYYVGIKPRGNGAKYKFGRNHYPEFVSRVNEDHPAVLAMYDREAGCRPDSKNMLNELCDAVDRGDLGAAQALVGIVRTAFNL